MSNNKQQFNTYLPANLILSVKHRAIDDQLSLSDWMEKALSVYLGQALEPTIQVKGEKMTTAKNQETQLKVMPLVHVENLKQSIKFFETLGFKLLFQSRDEDWGQIEMNGCEIGLLAHPAAGGDERIELNFMSDKPLGEVEKKLRTSGIKIIKSASDEGFGEQLQIEDADGHKIKINRLTPETFV